MSEFAISILESSGTETAKLHALLSTPQPDKPTCNSSPSNSSLPIHPAGSQLPSLQLCSHACRSSSSKHQHAPATPESSECHFQTPADESQSCAATNGNSPAWIFLQPASPCRSTVEPYSHERDGAGSANDPRIQPANHTHLPTPLPRAASDPYSAWQPEKETANPPVYPHLSPSQPTQSAAKPNQHPRSNPSCVYESLWPTVLPIHVPSALEAEPSDPCFPCPPEPRSASCRNRYP